MIFIVHLMITLHGLVPQMATEMPCRMFTLLGRDAPACEIVSPRADVQARPGARAPPARPRRAVGRQRA